MTKLEQFSEHLWTVPFPLKVMGMQMGTRTTIVGLPSGGLVLISPGPFSQDDVTAIEALGPVESIVAPNLMHHLFFNDACRQWPQARALVPRGLSKKIDLVERAVDLAEEGDFQGCLSWQRIEGMPRVREHVFIDARDEVLILTDLAFHFVDHPQWWLRTVMRVNGAYGRLGPSRLLRSVIDDDEAFSSSLRGLLDASWDRIVLAHGDLVPSGGRQAFLEGFARYLEQ